MAYIIWFNLWSPLELCLEAGRNEDVAPGCKLSDKILGHVFASKFAWPFLLIGKHPAEERPKIAVAVNWSVIVTRYAMKGHCFTEGYS